MAFFALLIAAVAATPNCNYCKLMDTYSGFLYNYGYCKSTDTCVLDVWNHPNQWCDDAWIDGYTLDLTSGCGAGIAICQPFVSSELYNGKNMTGTRTLGAGEMCTISIDATNHVARVLLEPNDNLGVMYNGYRKGTFLTVEPGKILDLTVYNGKTSGSLDFKFIYTGGLRLVASAAVATAGMILSLA